MFKNENGDLSWHYFFVRPFVMTSKGAGPEFPKSVSTILKLEAVQRVHYREHMDLVQNVFQTSLVLFY